MAYECEICDGGDGPLFKLTAEDDRERPLTGRSSPTTSAAALHRCMQDYWGALAHECNLCPCTASLQVRRAVRWPAVA